MAIATSCASNRELPVLLPPGPPRRSTLSCFRRACPGGARNLPATPKRAPAVLLPPGLSRRSTQLAGYTQARARCLASAGPVPAEHATCRLHASARPLSCFRRARPGGARNLPATRKRAPAVLLPSGLSRRSTQLAYPRPNTRSTLPRSTWQPKSIARCSDQPRSITNRSASTLASTRLYIRNFGSPNSSLYMSL